MRLTSSPPIQRVAERTQSVCAFVQSRVSALPLALRIAAGWWALLCGAYLALIYVTLATASQHRAHVSGASWAHRALAAFGGWDTYNFYLPIATTGYHKLSYAGFFPLYPLLIHLATLLPGVGARHALAAATVIGLAAALLALWGLAQLALETGQDTSRTLRITLAYPLAFFLFVPQTEGILLACAVWMFWALRHERWYLAAALSFVGALDRPTGVVLWLPLVWEYLRVRSGGWQWVRAPSWRRVWLRALRYDGATRSRFIQTVAQAVMVLGALPMAEALWLAIERANYGDPFAYVHQQQLVFSHHLSWPWQTLGLIIHTLFTQPFGSFAEARYLLDLAPLVLFTIIALALLRRWPVSYSLYTLGVIALCILEPVYGPGTFPDPVVSAGRYLTAAFPVFLALSSWAGRARWCEDLLVISGIMLQAAVFIAFVIGVWIV